MTRSWTLALLLLTGLTLFSRGAEAQKAPDQRRLLRIESRVYGWYGVAEPAFDKTVGRRELFKIVASDRFLQGLDGRLVVLQGAFQDGLLELGELAPPPLSVPEGARRQRFTIDRLEDGVLHSLDGYRLQPEPQSAIAAGMRIDAVVTPLTGNTWQILTVLEAEQPLPAASAPASTASLLSAAPPALPGGASLELELSQECLDEVVDLARRQWGLQRTFQGVSLQASHLRVLLPEAGTPAETPWRLEGSVELGTSGWGSVAESSFVISARPLIANQILYLEPRWSDMRLEGQLPFGFRLDGALLGELVTLLPARLPLLDLNWITSYLRHRELLTEEPGQWFLTPGQGTLRLGLGPEGSQLTGPSSGLQPGLFRVHLAAPLADRLVRHGVETYLDPETPLVPNPPIRVGQVLFLSIKVERVFLRSVHSGYSRGAFRFDDLVVDVGWKAGPLGGVEPLLAASGFIRPRLSAPSPEGPRFWDWDVDIETLVVRSRKLPGDPVQTAQDAIPRLEKELGTELAQRHRLPAVLPLSALLGQALVEPEASLEVTELRPLDDSLELRGRLRRPSALRLAPLWAGSPAE